MLSTEYKIPVLKSLLDSLWSFYVRVSGCLPFDLTQRRTDERRELREIAVKHSEAFSTGEIVEMVISKISQVLAEQWSCKENFDKRICEDLGSQFMLRYGFDCWASTAKNARELSTDDYDGLKDRVLNKETIREAGQIVYQAKQSKAGKLPRSKPEKKLEKIRHDDFESLNQIAI